MLIVFFIL